MIFVFSIVLLIFTYSVVSTPQLALQTANRCINCHLSESGSGLRNENGWRTIGKLSLINPEWIGLKDFFDLTKLTNSALDGNLYFGVDVRAQSSKSLKPSSQRRFFVKQITTNTAYQATDWLNLEAGYNFADIVYKNHGQTSWTASVVLDLLPEIPRLRIGFFQPGFGIRYDDHTMLIRMIANENVYANPLFAIDYTDYGFELNKDVFSPSPEWIFNLSGGIFKSTNLSKVKINSIFGHQPLVDNDNLTYVFKAIINETIGFSDFTNSYAGSSILYSTDFSLLNYFAGINFLKRYSLLVEYSTGKKGDILSLENFQGILSFKILDAVYFEIRAERARSNFKSLELSNTTQQLVFASQIFLLPFLEIKPEFRFIETEMNPRDYTQYRGTLFLLQAHLFY
jgi:hypothetical protein